MTAPQNANPRSKPATLALGTLSRRSLWTRTSTFGMFQRQATGEGTTLSVAPRALHVLQTQTLLRAPTCLADTCACACRSGNCTWPSSGGVPWKGLDTRRQDCTQSRKPYSYASAACTLKAFKRTPSDIFCAKRSPHFKVTHLPHAHEDACSTFPARVL